MSPKSFAKDVVERLAIVTPSSRVDAAEFLSSKNMAVLMTRRLFSKEVRVSSNVAGRNKNKLNPQIITYIRKIVFAFSKCSIGYFKRVG